MGNHHKNLLNNLGELRKSVGLTQQELSESAELVAFAVIEVGSGLIFGVEESVDTSVEEIVEVSNVVSERVDLSNVVSERVDVLNVVDVG